MWNGEYLRHIYPHATKFQVFKYKLAMFIRRVLIKVLIVTKVVVIAGFILGAFYGTFHLGKATTEPIQVKAEDKSFAIFSSRIDKLKDEVINKLKDCERNGGKESDGLVTYDPLQSNPSATPKRNIPSFGLLQFKKDTVIHYYKMKTGVTLTPKEAVILALDDVKSSELAKYVAFETKGKIGGDWILCNQKYTPSLDAQIDMIKNLEKI